MLTGIYLRGLMPGVLIGAGIVAAPHLAGPSLIVAGLSLAAIVAVVMMDLLELNRATVDDAAKPSPYDDDDDVFGNGGE